MALASRPWGACQLSLSRVVETDPARSRGPGLLKISHSHTSHFKSTAKLRWCLLSRRQLGMVVGRTKFLFLLDLFVGTARFRVEVTEGIHSGSLEGSPSGLCSGQRRDDKLNIACGNKPILASPYPPQGIWFLS